MSISEIFFNPGENRPRMFWRVFGQLLLLAIFSIGVSIVTTVLYQRFHPEKPLSSQAIIEFLTGTPPMILLNVVLTGIAMMLSCWLAIRLLDRRAVWQYGLGLSPQWWRQLGFGLILGAVLMAIVFFVELAAGLITVEGFLVSKGRLPFGVGILFTLIAALLVGFYEEFTIRGYLMTNFSQGFRGLFGDRGAVLLAWIISSAIFGVAHGLNPGMTVMSTLNIVLVGVLLLGFGYMLTGSLAIPIGIHITWNFFQGSVFGFPVSGTSYNSVSFIAIEQHGGTLLTGGDFGPEAGLIGSAVMVLGALLILWYVRREQGEISIHGPIAHPGELESMEDSGG